MCLIDSGREFYIRGRCEDVYNYRICVYGYDLKRNLQGYLLDNAEDIEKRAVRDRPFFVGLFSLNKDAYNSHYDAERSTG